jgi:HEAT repeat protein
MLPTISDSTHTPSAEPALRELLADPNQDVREIAGEALQRLAGAE